MTPNKYETAIEDLVISISVIEPLYIFHVPALIC